MRAGRPPRACPSYALRAPARWSHIPPFPADPREVAEWINGPPRLNRLTTQDGATVAAYDPAGNLSSRAGVGDYDYYPASHRVRSAGGHTLSYDANGNVFAITGPLPRTLTYLPFNLPSRITAGSNTLDYLYDAAHARIKETSQTAQGTAQTWYLGAYEEHTRTDGEVEQRHTLATPDGPVGMITRRSTSGSVVYWHRDHLGSVVAISDPAGGNLQRYAYDAWGARSGGTAGGEERGYTGHEHLVEAGLIHMNGRLYFEGIGRFLQADPFVQAPYDGQNYNRYSYVMNNPLSLTDPSGYSARWLRPILAIAAAITMQYYIMPALLNSAVASAVMTQATANFIGAVAAGFAAGGIGGGNIESALQGAFFAAAFYGAGEWSGAHAAGDALAFGSTVHLAQTAAHAVVGCVQAATAGGSCGRGALSAGFAAFAGPALPGEPRSTARLVATVVAGGTASKLGGGNFANGATTAAFGYLFSGALRSGGSSLTLSYETMPGDPSYGDNGAAGWRIRWSLSSPSPAGGFIVQEMNIGGGLIDSNGELTAVKSPTYWEAWRVGPGSTRTDTGIVYDDTWASSGNPRAVMGSITWQGTARFYEGLALPPTFVNGGAAPYAKGMPSTFTDPKLSTSNATAPVDRAWNVKW